MKLSKSTLAILKNFTSINNGIVFEPGNIIQVVRTNDSQTMARATIDTNIEAPFSILDLSQFIGVLSTFDDPDLVIDKKWLTIVEGGRRLKYVFGDPRLIPTLPYNDPELKDPLVNFVLTKNDLVQITRLASMLKAPYLSFVSRDRSFAIEATNVKNETDNIYSHKIDTKVEKDFTLVFEGNKFDWFLPVDMELTVNSRMTKFVGPAITYWTSYIPQFSSVEK